MLGLFNIFGRSDSLKALDQALREIGTHPRVVPEPVKLTAVKLVKSESVGQGKIPDAAYAHAVELLGYCILGPDQFTANTSLDMARRAEARFETAITDGEGLDASLILLALHADVINAKIAARFDVETG
ncbi:MAG: hypothetical protein AAFU49_04045 [Pseudomonadota bacterium]